MNQTTLLIVCIAGAFVISTITSSIVASKIARKKTYRQINKALDKTDNIKSYKQIAEIAAAITEQNIEEHGDINGKIDELIEDKISNIKKVASLRYDSTPDSGGKMSFSVALLNERNTGIVITNIYMREGSFLYLREIVSGKCDIELSEEEKHVLNKVMKL